VASKRRRAGGAMGPLSGGAGGAHSLALGMDLRVRG
jgi:hypothetical protein